MMSFKSNRISDELDSLEKITSSLSIYSFQVTFIYKYRLRNKNNLQLSIKIGSSEYVGPL